MKNRLLLLCALCLLACLACASGAGEAYISEVCTANSCILFDEMGNTPDWVELHNPGADALPLDGYALCDREDGRSALPLDGLAIPAGGYCLIPLPGAGFGLSAAGETVYLFKDGAAADSLACPALDKNTSFARINGEEVITALPTPGGVNRHLPPDGLFEPAQGVRFSEFMASAAPYKATEGLDWLEITNTGNGKVNLRGYTIRLGMAGEKAYTFDSVYLSIDQYMGIYCADKPLNARSTGFKIPAQNAVLSLWNAAGELIDFVRLGTQYANISCGRAAGEVHLSYFANDTFGSKNRMAYAGRADAPALSLPGGRYDGAVTVSTQAQPGAVVRYTNNGSVPTADDGIFTDSATFAETTSLTVCAFVDGLLPSEPVSATYVIGLEVDTPVVCLTVDRVHLYGESDGILAKGSGEKPNYAQNWEYPATFEYMDAAGNLVLSQRCGIGVQGNSSRVNLQKSFQLAARKAYGDGSFHFNPFENRDFTSYRSLNLRAAGSEGNTSTRFRDAFLSSLAEGTHMLYADAQPVLVYLNGRLWGQYNLRERMNKHFVAQHNGITDEATEDAIDLLSENGNVVHNGDDADYKALSRFMKKNDLKIQANLDYVLSQMDVDSYFDYVCFMLITGNRDLSNTRFYRVPGGKWTWMLCDLDRAMEHVDNTSAFWLYTLKIDHAQEYMTDHVPFAALMKVPAMREKFLSRLGELLAEKFTPDALTAGVDAWAARLAPLIPYHMERWELATPHYWDVQVRELRGIVQERPALVVKYAQQYFRLSDEDTRRYFGAFLKGQ